MTENGNYLNNPNPPIEIRSQASSLFVQWVEGTNIAINSFQNPLYKFIIVE